MSYCDYLSQKQVTRQGKKQGYQNCWAETANQLYIPKVHFELGHLSRNYMDIKMLHKIIKNSFAYIKFLSRNIYISHIHNRNYV